MTNSQSKTTAKLSFNKSFNGNVSIGSNSSGGGGLVVNNRNYNNTSPNNKKNSSFFANNSFNNRGQQKSPRTVQMGTSNPINIQQQTPNKYNNYNNNYISFTTNSPNNSQRSQRSSPPMMTGSPPRMGSCSPPNPNYFAGSKCFDAPKADQLPKPPMHWRSSCASEFASNMVQQNNHMIPVHA
jgi:hypothetical protein